jgi:hypothetical protein
MEQDGPVIRRPGGAPWLNVQSSCKPVASCPSCQCFSRPSVGTPAASATATPDADYADSLGWPSPAGLRPVGLYSFVNGPGTLGHSEPAGEESSRSLYRGASLGRDAKDSSRSLGMTAGRLWAGSSARPGARPRNPRNPRNPRQALPLTARPGRERSDRAASRTTDPVATSIGATCVDPHSSRCDRARCF